MFVYTVQRKSLTVETLINDWQFIKAFPANLFTLNEAYNLFVKVLYVPHLSVGVFKYFVFDL